MVNVFYADYTVQLPEKADQEASNCPEPCEQAISLFEGGLEYLVHIVPLAALNGGQVHRDANYTMKRRMPK